MKLLELTKNRYSCRNYLPTSVEQEKLDYIMECVRLAPSACNKQPWTFRIITDEEERKKLGQCYNREWFATAPVMIIASILHDEEWVRGDGKHMATSILPLPWSIFAWLLLNRGLAPAGCATSIPNYAKVCSDYQKMKNPPC